MKFVLTSMYNINFKDWNIDCINNIAKTYSKISKYIAL